MGGQSHAQIIFLDIDGVLVTPRTESIVVGNYSQFDADCVAILNRITALTDAVLVLSSSWRVGEDMDELRAYFVSQGILGAVVDATPVRADHDREREILAWLGDQPHRPRFAIIDDDCWFDQLVPWHVHTDSATGLTEQAGDAARQLLLASE